MHGKTVILCTPKVRDIMSLDDYFTLTEMNNGLTAPSRVRELMAVMQKERDYSITSAADSAKQRSCVASVILATENKDCLDVFLELDGLQYICNWLKDAQRSSKDTNNSSLEEHITHLLQVLGKLSVGDEKTIASEIWTTVENLDHSSCQIQDEARALLGFWKAKEHIDVGCSETSVNNSEHKIARDLKEDAVIHHQIETTHESHKISNPPNMGDRFIDHHVSSLSSPKPTEGPSHSHSVGISNSLEPLSQASSRQNTAGAGLYFNAQRANPPEDITIHSTLQNSNDGLLHVDGNNEGEHGSDANHCRGSGDFVPKEGGDINCRALPESSGTISWGNFLSGISNFVKANDFDDNRTPSKKQSDREESDPTGKRPGVEIDYSIVDPLEVARQVAMEVEREIMDYREQSCSSPENFTGSNNSPRAEHLDSVSGRNSDSPMVESNGSSSSNSSATSSENSDTDGTQELATSAPEEAETEKKSLRNFFDLNQEIMPDDCDACPENHFSCAVSVVSASRATPSASKPPDGPLEFEGNLGWKGTALTSAFRPAPTRQAPKSERQTCGIDFDLNVSESIDESSAETNSNKPGHLELDLNRSSEDGGMGLLDWRIGSFYPQPSPPWPMRGVDLTDRQSFANVSSNNSSYMISKTSQDFCDPAITLMGKRVEVEGKDFFAPQTLPSQNRRNSEVAVDYNFGRMNNFFGIGPKVPYAAHSPVYGHSNVTPGPIMPYLGPVYDLGHHPIPYMMDLRAAPMVPQAQIMGSASAFSQTPFLVNMNGLGPSSCHQVESGSRDPSGLGLLLNSTLVRPIGGPSSQNTMGPSVGGKRKEPDNGYDDRYSSSFKHFLPNWKQS